jgi:micrococcal nuclease
MKCLLIAFGLAVTACACAPQDMNARVATGVAKTLAAWPWPTDTPGPTDTPPPSPTPTLTLEPSPTIEITPTVEIPQVEGGDCIPQNTLRQIAQVASVTDGDTIRVDIDGVNYPLRYIGMDTAEANEPYGSTATAANRVLVEGKKVLLVKDVSETDVYDRLLRYVIADGVFVNYELVRKGHARATDYPPDSSCGLTFATAERHAREEGRGIWAATPTPKPQPTAIPLPTATSKPAPTQRSGDCDPAYPTVCIPYRRFRVLSPDPHHFDADHDGIGCESG